MNKLKISFWVSIIMLSLVLLTTFAIDQFPDRKWLNDAFDVSTYLCMFSLGCFTGLSFFVRRSRNDPTK